MKATWLQRLNLASIFFSLVLWGSASPAGAAEFPSTLIEAIQGNARFSVIQILLSQGADVNITDEQGQTPLILAAKKSQFELMHALLIRGADISHRDNFGWTALTRALLSARTKQEQFKLLGLCLDKGADVYQAFPTDPLAFKDLPDLVQLQGRTLLSWSIESTSDQITALLLRLTKGKDIRAYLNQSDMMGKTALIQASESGRFDLWPTLLERGADINAKDSLGWTALTKALLSSSKDGYLTILKFFLDQGANPSEVFPVDPKAYSNSKIYQKLSGRSILVWAVDNALAKVISLLISRGVNFAELGPIDEILMSAVGRGNLEMVKMAAAHGAILDPKQPALPTELPEEHTPLSLAAEKGHVEIVNYLLDHGCNPGQRGKDGVPALVSAARRSDVQMIGLFLEFYGRLYVQMPEASPEALSIIEVGALVKKKLNPSLAKWIEFYAWSQVAAQLTEILEIKSEMTLYFDSNQESRGLGTDFQLRVNQLRQLINLKAKSLYYLERELALHDEFSKMSLYDVKPDRCLRCFDDAPVGAVIPPGPGGCACYLCEECAQDFCSFVIDRDGDNVSLCTHCKTPVQSDYLKQMGRSEAEINKFRIRQIDHVNARATGWGFCPTEGCSGGRVIQVDEKAAYYSCFLCDRDGCLKCGSDHRGDCTENAAQAKGLEELLRLGAMEPPEESPEDAKHPDYFKGRYRPCYYCGVATFRMDGCNQMTCLRCNKKWDWNNGPEGRNGDFTKGPMNFTPLQPAHF
ncbi:MAG: ankyrin repeat domain-containing protein [Bdellovibrionia bacterium]